MKPPALKHQVTAAEVRFAASRERTRVAVEKLRLTFQSKFARPSTLIWAAGVGVLIGKFLLHPHHPHHARDGLAKTGIAAALLSRFGWKSLAGAALQMWVSRQRSSPPLHMSPHMTPPHMTPPHMTPPGASARTVRDTLH
jgi:hypothetical protein